MTKDRKAISNVSIKQIEGTDRSFAVVPLEQGEQLWWKQIYVVKFDPILERDVQEVFVTAIKPAEGSLLISNEAGGEFSLDLKSLEVKVIRGAIVVHPERR